MNNLLLKSTITCLIAFGFVELAAEESNLADRMEISESGQLSLKRKFSEKLILPLGAEDFGRFKANNLKYIPDSRAYIQEWVAEGKDSNSLDEKITIIHERRKQLSICQLEVKMRNIGREMYAGSEYHLRTVHKSKGDIILISEAPNGHKDIPPFTAIMRHCFTPSGDQYIVYEKKNGVLSQDEKEMWVEKLKQAYVSDDTTQLGMK